MSRLRNIPGADEILAGTPEVILDPAACRGNWRKEVFGNDHPLHLEIGMGKGKFLTSLSLKNPGINYVGMELYSSVLIKAIRRMNRMRAAAGRDGGADPDSLFTNLRLLCADARSVPEIFSPGEVDVIYLNFSDPWPKTRHANRRLTAAPFLARYDQVVSEDGRIEFKTDDQDLFDFSLQQVQDSEAWETYAVTRDLHQDPLMNAENIRTEYEEKFADHPICKMIIRRSVTEKTRNPNTAVTFSSENLKDC